MWVCDGHSYIFGSCAKCTQNNDNALLPTKKMLLQFQGWVRYYRCFCRFFIIIIVVAHLTNLLKSEDKLVLFSARKLSTMLKPWFVISCFGFSLPPNKDNKLAQHKTKISPQIVPTIDCVWCLHFDWQVCLSQFFGQSWPAAASLGSVSSVLQTLTVIIWRNMTMDALSWAPCQQCLFCTWLTPTFYLFKEPIDRDGGGLQGLTTTGHSTSFPSVCS